MKESIWLGALFTLLAAISLTGMNIFVKLIGPSIPIYELIWVRFFIGLILLLPIIFLSKNFSFKLNNPFKFLLRTISALLGMSLLFMAVQKISLSQALLLANTTPLIVPIFAYLMTRSKLTTLGIIGIIIGFIGVGVVLDPKHTSLGVGALLALGSAFFVGLAIIQVRLLGKTMKILPLLFYYFLMSTALMTPFGLIKIAIPSSEKITLFLILIGIIGFIYQICSTLSYKLAPVRLTTPILYVNVLLGGLFEWIVWGQKPSLSFLVGCIIIIVGVVITLFFGTSKNSLKTGDSHEKQSFK